LASRFGHKYLRAGFKFRISKKDLKKGRYKIGIMIVNTKNEKIEGFIYSDTELVYKDTYVGDYAVGKAMTGSLDFPERTEGLKHSMQFKAHPKSIIINGWSFIEGLDAKDYQIYLVFKSDMATYIFGTVGNRRHELAKKYGKQYVDAGFTINIKKKRLQSGNYQLGIIIAKKGKIVGFKFTKQHQEI